jgi:hypothetical protein
MPATAGTQTRRCEFCGATEFRVKDKSYELALACDDCRVVMCHACSGRVTEGELKVLCCCRCRSTKLMEYEIWIATQELREKIKSRGN